MNVNPNWSNNLWTWCAQTRSAQHPVDPKVSLRTAALICSIPDRMLPRMEERWGFSGVVGAASPLSGRVGVQHAAPLHPAPDVHPSERLLFQAAAAPLDALLNSKHEQNSPESAPLLSLRPSARLMFTFSAPDPALWSALVRSSAAAARTSLRISLYSSSQK